MCDVDRFLARGASIYNTSFHHTTCNLGRIKASGMVVANSTFANANTNLEITGLQNWVRDVRIISCT